MSYLEAAVVVYLRQLYYPDGFNFPMVIIPSFIYWVEIGREAATIIMLWAVAKLLAQKKREWFAFFSFNFGIWDIWYYIWLKILLNWPSSLLDWDILFLIPLPWTSPVLAPVIVSLALIIAAILILKYPLLKLSRTDWILEAVAGLLIIWSFLLQINRIASGQLPENYCWSLFISGMVLGLVVFIYRLIKIIQK